MAILTNKPLSYDTWGITELSIEAPNVIEGPVSLKAKFRLYRVDDEGKADFHPDIVKELHVPDLYQLAANSPELSNVMDIVIAAVGELGKSHGVIS